MTGMEEEEEEEEEKPGLRRLTMFVLSQLQNSCTPLDAAQGLPMRLVKAG